MSTRLKGARTPLLEASDYFANHAAVRLVDVSTPSDAYKFFHGKLSPAAAHRHYTNLVRICSSLGKDTAWVDSVARGFARRLVAIMVTQAKLEDHVTLAAKTPFYGFPSPHEILTGENSDENQN